MKKVWSMVLITLFISTAIFAGGQTEAYSADLPSVDGIVEYFEGDVSINNEQADFGMRVPYGSIIKTGVGAYCEVVFENKNVFRIMESTIVEIRLSVDAPEIIVDKGSFAALFTKLTAFTSDLPFRIRTQTTLAGVRGTAFFVKVEDPDTTYICICNGELEMSQPDGSAGTRFSGTHHKASYYKKINGNIEVSTAPLLYHTDEDMDSLAARIDERIPWDYSASY